MKKKLKSFLMLHVIPPNWPALKPYRPRMLVREFARSLRRELDLAVECHNAERVAANLARVPFITIPRVHWEYTKRRINVQDYVDGTPGEDLAAVDAGGFDRPLLARRGAQSVMKMIIEDGFFHADPHPGNVFYLPGNRFALIDFGMVGRLSQRRRDELLQLLLGLVQREPQPVADVLLDWTDLGNGFEVLKATVSYGGRSQPVAWVTTRKGFYGRSRNLFESNFCRLLKTLVPPGIVLVIVADRGFARGTAVSRPEEGTPGGG